MRLFDPPEKRPDHRLPPDGPLELISGDLEHKPELPILLDLLADHEESGLRRWLRTAGPNGRPLDLLLARDFAGFENALATLSEIGFVIRRRT